MLLTESRIGLMRSLNLTGSWSKTKKTCREHGMNTLAPEIRTALAQNVFVTDDSLIVDLDDGRTISVPLAWFPRLLNGSEEERNNWRFIGRGEGIHWPELDEDISIEGIIFGKPSVESQPSFKRWLEGRQKSRSARG